MLDLGAMGALEQAKELYYCLSKLPSQGLESLLRIMGMKLFFTYLSQYNNVNFGTLFHVEDI